MFNKNIDYTVCSEDPEHYNRISANLMSPPTFLARIIVTSLTAKCSIVVLNDKDFITINKKTYYFTDSFTEMTVDGFRDLLAQLIREDGFIVSLKYTQQINIAHTEPFTIDNASYNVRLLCGYYNTFIPIKSEYIAEGNYSITSESVGYYLSTPILYLVSNIGKQSYRTGNRSEFDMAGSKILMRINNSYSANYPIVANNGDFSTEVVSNDLSDARFVLVDANMHELNLLCPIYISINITGVDEYQAAEVQK